MAYRAALLGLLLVTAGCGGHGGGGLASADRAACAHATPVEKGIAHLRHFDVWAAVLTSRVATDPLYPNYPDALLPGKIGIAPHKRLPGPVTVTAFYCPNGSPIRLFEASPEHANLSIPRPASASVVKTAGTPEVRLRWPPPVESLGDPARWFVTPLDYKPGTAVWRFTVAHRVIDRLTFKVCAADAFGRCRTR